MRVLDRMGAQSTVWVGRVLEIIWQRQKALTHGRGTQKIDLAKTKTGKTWSWKMVELVLKNSWQRRKRLCL